ncbi:MAG: hypothetical protein GQ574_09865 [Crocinitomix sp.]|nr:hypothetical protein [Crocinitomix sp.]
MRQYYFLFILSIILLTGCNSQSDKSVISLSLADSASSSITLNTDQTIKVITNTSYDTQPINYGDKKGNYITRRTAIKTYSQSVFGRNKKVTIEFLDFDFNHQFEISHEPGNIDLWGGFYITSSLIDYYPGFFDIYNYGSEEPFVKCQNLCWRVRVLGSKGSEAFISYQENILTKTTEKRKALGGLYFSVDQNPPSSIQFFDNLEDSLTYFNPFKIHIEPHNEEDSYVIEYARYFSGIQLNSNPNRQGAEFMTDFDIVITFIYSSIYADSRADEKTIRIPVENGVMISESEVEF